jgi:hypothetical protein
MPHKFTFDRHGFDLAQATQKLVNPINLGAKNDLALSTIGRSAVHVWKLLPLAFLKPAIFQWTPR